MARPLVGQLQREYSLVLRESGREMKIIEIIQQSPGITTKEIADRLKLTSPRIWTILQPLLKEGLLVKKRQQQKEMYFINDNF